MSARKYKKFLSNPNVPIPRTTAWRYQKHCRRTDYDSDDIDTIDRGTILHEHSDVTVKRKAYVTDINKSIPRQTLWYWKRRGKYQLTDGVASIIAMMISIIT